MFFKIFNCLVRRDKLKLTVQTQKQNLLPQMEKLHNYIPVRITLYFLYFST